RGLQPPNADRHPCPSASTPVHVLATRVRGPRRPTLLRAGPVRDLPTRRGPRGQDPPRRQARRPPRRTATEIRPHRQPPDRQGARLDDPVVGAAAGGRGDRVSPGGHLLTTVLAAGAGLVATGSVPVAVGVVAGGFLIDTDHLVDYVLVERRRELTPAAFLRHYNEGHTRRVVLVLHSYEVFLALAGLAWWLDSAWLAGYLAGGAMHPEAPRVYLAGTGAGESQTPADRVERRGRMAIEAEAAAEDQTLVRGEGVEHRHEVRALAQQGADGVARARRGIGDEVGDTALPFLQRRLEGHRPLADLLELLHLLDVHAEGGGQ